MSIIRYIARLALAAVMAGPGILNAAIVFPALDIQDKGSDLGATFTTDSFSVDATAFSIITDSDPIDIPDETFTLTSTSGSYDPTADSGMFAGTFTVSGGLLSGSFSNLEVYRLGGGYNFAADLTFDSGILKGGFASGRIEGTISGNSVVATLGAVSTVPVPAAVWLFGSGLLGLASAARRKST